MTSRFDSPRPLSFLLFCLFVSTVTAACQPPANSFFTPVETRDKPKPCSLEFVDGPKKGKEAIVAVFTSDGPEVRPEDTGYNRLLEAEIVATLPQMTRESKQNVSLVDPARVKKFRDNSPYWYYRHPREWGRQLKADLVLRVSVDKLSFSRSEVPGTQNQCRSELTVDVYDVDAGKVKPKYHFSEPFDFPLSGEVKGPTAVDLDSFKRQVLHQMAVEVCKKLLAPQASP